VKVGKPGIEAAYGGSGRGVVGRFPTLTPPDPQLKGAWYPGGFNPRTYQAKHRFQNVPFKMQLCTATGWEESPRGLSQTFAVLADRMAVAGRPRQGAYHLLTIVHFCYEPHLSCFYSLYYH
jgi:hypothetical protein